MSGQYPYNAQAPQGPPQQNPSWPPHGAPQGSYGAPQTYGQYPPPALPGHQAPAYGSQPPNYPPSDAKYAQEKPSHQPPQAQQSALNDPRFISFTFSGTTKTIRDSRVTDPWGRTVLTITSTKKESTLQNMSGQVLAAVEWKHSLPRIHYRGALVKSKELFPLDRKQMIRSMTHEGHTYGWRGLGDAVGLYPASSPDKCIAHWHDENDIVVLKASPEVFETGMLDICLLAVFMMACGVELEDGGGGGPNIPLITAISALITAA
ncbi:hypothetical protein B0H15DRAFT_945281 [Mycena belliarum]|uniref:DUF6593 domain-containing protein n=1 Tax=Mycena belliarum TaxID=1033014 RepID=A0AAD6UHH3_9AGAR|nr:hypothetical protein B0H15DRAFT_945281 [Mycena belliae]